jgi:DNA-3-methyladenine glycosylase I
MEKFQKRNCPLELDTNDEFGSFDKYIWSFTKNKSVVNNWNSISEVPATSELSDQVSSDLKARGFKFMGTTIVYAHLQATGIINDHITSCFRHNYIKQL